MENVRLKHLVNFTEKYISGEIVPGNAALLQKYKVYYKHVDKLYI